MGNFDNNNLLKDFSTIVEFSNLINSNLEIDFTLNNLLLTCFGKFHSSKGIIALSDNGILKIKAYKGFTKNVLNDFPHISIKEYDDNPEKINEYCELHNLPVCQKIITSNGFIGLLMLGQRLTKEPYYEMDKEFLRTLLNLGGSAIDNALMFGKLNNLNRDLDAKVNQLSSLFDLSKEFSGILEEKMVIKLLVFSIIGQLLVSKFAFVTILNDEINLLENKFSIPELKSLISKEFVQNVNKTIVIDEKSHEFSDWASIEVKVIIPLQIKGINRGLILLGSRKNNRPFSNSDLEFVASVGSLAIISIENARLFNEAIEKQKLEKELETARTIQQNLLPTSLPQSDLFEISAFNKTAKQVGGDYFDVIRLDKERVLIAIADVSGKGVQAALLMANLQAFLKSICKQNISLDKASNLINDLVSENTVGGSFITFFWGIIDEKNRTFTYVNAGHNPPIMISNGKKSFLKKGGMILGVIETLEPYVSTKIDIHKDDCIVLFTDGITEAFSKDLEEFGDKKLESIVEKNANKNSKEILDSIINTVQAHTVGAEQSDDITLMIIKFR